MKLNLLFVVGIIIMVLIGHEIDRGTLNKVYEILETNEELTAEEAAFVEFFVSKAPDPLLMDKEHTEMFIKKFGRAP